MVSSYLDLLDEDLITKIFEMLAMAIEKEIVAAEITLDNIDDRVCGNNITDKWLLGLDIIKKQNPRKIRIMVDNKEYTVPYDVYSITYGHIKYDIADPHLNSNTHLFTRYPLDNVIVILRQDTGDEFGYGDINNTGTAYTGTPVPLPEGELVIFAQNKFKPECCPSPYSSSTGCACITPEQYNYLNTRGGNRTSDSGV